MNLPAALNLVEPLDRQTLGERAYAKLADLLISGRLAPGEKLSLRAAADVLGVSIMPVREAVSRLVADKALEVTPNRAVRVPLMSAAQFRDLTKVRIAIEGHAAAQAAHASRQGRPCVDRARGSRPCGRKAKLPAPDLPRAVELNKTFHFAVYEAAHSPILVEIIRALWLKAGPVINLDLRANPERLAKGDAIKCHADVRKAIVAGDGGAARDGSRRRHQRRGRFHSVSRRSRRLTIFSKRHLGAIMDLDIKGLRVLVTAGAGGIGLAIARRFAAEGAKVHTCDVDEMALSALANSDPTITVDTLRRLRSRGGRETCSRTRWQNSAASTCWSTMPGSPGRRRRSRR